MIPLMILENLETLLKVHAPQNQSKIVRSPPNQLIKLLKIAKIAKKMVKGDRPLQSISFLSKYTHLYGGQKGTGVSYISNTLFFKNSYSF